MPVSALVMATPPSRLEPLLGPEGCARLEGALIRAATAWAAEVSPGGAYLAHGGDEEALRPHAAAGVRTFAGARGDPGDRLATATAHVFRERAEPLLVVGTDMPLLTPAHAREAEAVLRGGADVAFGPAPDGGYWMVAMARPAPDLFELGADWGGAAVLERSLERCAAAGLRVELLGTQRKLDDSADMRALAGHPRLPPAVAEILAPE